MKIETSVGIPIDSVYLQKYFAHLVDQFFKILPMRECGEETLPTYMQSLQRELLGCQGLVFRLQAEPMFVSLLAILQAMIDAPDSEVSDVKRDVFKAITICNKMKDLYAERHCNKVAE